MQVHDAGRCIEREDGKRLYIIRLAYKERPEDRRVYRAVCDPQDFYDLEDSEGKEVGDPARYAQWLSEEELGRIRQMRPQNVEYIEAAAEVRAVGDVEPAEEEEAAELAGEVRRFGVQRAALEWHGFFDGTGHNGRGVAVMVCDTGYAPHPYLRGKVRHVWEFTGEGRKGRTENMHGPWCLGAALPAEAEGISAKVLTESGRGSTADVVRSWVRFRNFCARKGIKGVISCSIGGPDVPLRTYADMAQELYADGVIVVAASGNDGRRNGIDAPANSPRVVSVGAHDWRGYAAGFANRAGDWAKPDLWALGVRVYGIGGYMSGTSMATPLVARAAANAQSVSGYPGCAIPRRVLINSAGKTKILNQRRMVRRLIRHPRRRRC